MFRSKMPREMALLEKKLIWFLVVAGKEWLLKPVNMRLPKEPPLQTLPVPFENRWFLLWPLIYSQAAKPPVVGGC